MSTLAVKKVMVENAIQEIALLKKGEIDAANVMLQTRITCMDKLWVVETYGNDPQYQDMVNYLWEEVKELTLLLTDSTDKDGILCLGSPPVIDDESEIVCPGQPSTLKFNITLDVEYIGNQGEADGLGGSFTIDSVTTEFEQYTKQYNETVPLVPDSYGIDFNNTEYYKNGVLSGTAIYYRYDEIDPWIEEPTKIVPFNIVNQNIDVFVKVEEVPPPTQYEVEVSLSYIGGNAANDGSGGSFIIVGEVTEPIPQYSLVNLFTYNLDIKEHTFDFGTTLYYIEGISKSFIVQYRTSLSDDWLEASGKSFQVDVDAPKTVYVQFVYDEPTEFNLGTHLEWNYASGSLNGFDGSYEVAGSTKSVTKYSESVTNNNLLSSDTYLIDFTNLLCLVGDVSSPYTLEYRYDVGDPWTLLGGKTMYMDMDSEHVDIYFRLTPDPGPTEYDLNLNLQWIGTSAPASGLSGTFLVDLFAQALPGTVEDYSNTYTLGLGSHTLDFDLTGYFVEGQQRERDLQYTTDGGTTWTPVVDDLINFDIVDQDITMTVQFALQPLPALDMNFDIIYNGTGGVDSGLLGSFSLIGSVAISPDYTTLFEYTEVALEAGTWAVDIGNLIFAVNGSSVPYDAEYRIDGGSWNPVVGNAFNVVQDGVSVKDVDIRLTQAQTTFNIQLDVTYEGPTGGSDGLVGDYELFGVTYPIDDFTKYFATIHGPYANGSYTVDFANILYMISAVSQVYSVQYKYSFGDAWQDAAGKLVPVQVNGADQPVFIRCFTEP